MARRVRVHTGILDAMLAQARAEWPRECCGLLAGVEGVISEIFPTSNQLQSETEYFISPQELIAALRSIRERGLAHLGIYHSHPHGKNILLAAIFRNPTIPPASISSLRLMPKRAPSEPSRFATVGRLRLKLRRWNMRMSSPRLRSDDRLKILPFQQFPMASTSIALISSGVSSIGFPRVLLARAAFSTSTGTSVRLTP